MLGMKREEGHQALLNYLIELYTDPYSKNDKAHQIPHVISVTMEALKINEQLDLSLDKGILVGAAMVHDLFNNDRDHHHELAGDYIRTSEVSWLQGFSTQERELMACAAAEHRASYKGSFTSLYSEVVSAADRGMPNIRSTVIRCGIYGMSRLGYDRERAYAHVVDHMKDKFSNQGYARYPEIYEKMYRDELKTLRDFMDTITIKQVKELWPQ